MILSETLDRSRASVRRKDAGTMQILGERKGEVGGCPLESSPGKRRPIAVLLASGPGTLQKGPGS
jgi:hypothetical protein